jgi:hypothetical protein
VEIVNKHCLQTFEHSVYHAEIDPEAPAFFFFPYLCKRAVIFRHTQQSRGRLVHLGWECGKSGFQLFL